MKQDRSTPITETAKTQIPSAPSLTLKSAASGAVESPPAEEKIWFLCVARAGTPASQCGTGVLARQIAENGLENWPKLPTEEQICSSAGGGV